MDTRYRKPQPGDRVAKSSEAREVLKVEHGDVTYINEKGQTKVATMAQWKEWCDEGVRAYVRRK